MADNKVIAQHHKTFENIRQLDDRNNEFWLSRQLSQVLEYSEYRHFLPVIEKAKKSCENSGNLINHHFEEILGMVDIGTGARGIMPELLPTPEKSIRQLERERSKAEEIE